MSIKAYATVRLTGCNIRRFINLCTANHIKIWNLKYVSPKEYEACCSTEDIFLTKPHLKKTHTRLLVVKRQGYFAIRAFLYKIRIITAAITGVFCIHALICTRIWHIVPEGNRFTYDESVISFMESENVTIGRYSKINKAIIDKNVEIPPHTEIGINKEDDLKRGFYVSKGGITVVPKDAIVNN